MRLVVSPAGGFPMFQCSQLHSQWEPWKAQNGSTWHSQELLLLWVPWRGHGCCWSLLCCTWAILVDPLSFAGGTTTAPDHCPFHMGISRLQGQDIYYWYLLVIPTYFIQIVARQFMHLLNSPFFMGISCQFPRTGWKKLDTIGFNQNSSLRLLHALAIFFVDETNILGE